MSWWSEKSAKDDSWEHNVSRCDQEYPGDGLTAEVLTVESRGRPPSPIMAGCPSESGRRFLDAGLPWRGDAGSRFELWTRRAAASRSGFGLSSAVLFAWWCWGGDRVASLPRSNEVDDVDARGLPYDETDVLLRINGESQRDSFHSRLAGREKNAKNKSLTGSGRDAQRGPQGSQARRGWRGYLGGHWGRLRTRRCRHDEAVSAPVTL
jgi:hypothetical protein